MRQLDVVRGAAMLDEPFMIAWYIRFSSSVSAIALPPCGKARASLLRLFIRNFYVKLRLAASISPGFSPLQYRWSALNLRKKSGLTPELLARVAPPKQVLSFPIPSLLLDAIPAEQGLYLFFTPSTCLYVGEAENLRNRIGKHLEHSDNKGLARWMWDQGATELFLELQVLDAATTQKVRRALERELIRGRNPLFNISR